METTCCFLTTTTTPLSQLLHTHRKYEDVDEGGGTSLEQRGDNTYSECQHKELIDYYDVQPKHNDDRVTDMILDDILLYKYSGRCLVVLRYVVVAVEIYCNFKLYETNVILTGISLIAHFLIKFTKSKVLESLRKIIFESRNVFIRLRIQNRYRIL